MRNVKWFVAAALVVSTAGCVETMDSGYAAPSYGYGYGNGYDSNGYSSGYYAQPAYSSGYYAQPGYSRSVVNNYYTSPQVVTQTRYVPVPQHRADRANDHRSDVRQNEPRHVDRQPSSPPAATHNNTSSGSHNDGNRHDGSRDNEHRG